MSAASRATPEAALLPPRARAALAHVEAIAASRRDAARSQLAEICAMAALPEEEGVHWRVGAVHGVVNVSFFGGHF